MSDSSVTQRVSTEGADMLTLAGVNDGNLVELWTWDVGEHLRR